MIFESYEDSKEERIENGIKITRYKPSERDGYRKVRSKYSKSRKSILNPIVVIERIGA